MSDTDAGLKVELFCDADAFETSNAVELRARFSNVGSEALTLTFWWNRKIEIRDASVAM